MMNWVKYLLVFILIFGVIIVGAVMNTQSKATQLSAQEVDVAMESALVGELRQESFKGVSIEESVANLVADVVNTQKDFDTPTRIDYVFLDSAGSPTDVEEDITQIQFQIVVMDKSGKDVRALASKRVALDVRSN